jgi:cytochrome c oxidase cbb3-type subunit 3
MRIGNSWRVRTGVAGLLAGLAIAGAGVAAAQEAAPPAGQTGRGGGARRVGGFVPGQQRTPAPPAQVERGKALYGINCTSCHGADLRGGDLGGPNLLRSQVALSDRDGELIVPIIQGSRQKEGMPAINVSPEDAQALAAWVRSVEETIGRQGTPPAAGVVPLSILTGNAGEGKTFFVTKCAGCHSPAGDLSGIASRIPDPKVLQNAWVSGGERGARGAAQASARAATVTVTPASGASVAGRLVRIDDFLVSVGLDDGTVRTFRRMGDTPKVEVHDPMKAHRDLLTTCTDKDMHDVTAYLVTLK